MAERVGRVDLVVRRSRRAMYSSSRVCEPRRCRAPRPGPSVARLGPPASRTPGEGPPTGRGGDPRRRAVGEPPRPRGGTSCTTGRSSISVEPMRRPWDAGRDIFESLGDLHAVATASNTLGAFAYFGGQWDEAITLYERMASSKEQLGDPVHAVNGTLNVAEVLSDQGRWEEAEERLRRVLRVWRGAGCDRRRVRLGLHGAGREPRRPLRRRSLCLTEARDAFAREGAHREAALAGSWLAECALFEGRWEDAAREAEDLLASEDASGSLLEQIRATPSRGSDSRGPGRYSMSLRLADEEGPRTSSARSR